jgi:hypothetical protein
MKLAWVLAALFAAGTLAACQSKNSPAGGDGSAGGLIIMDAGASTPVAPDGAASCSDACNYQTQEGCDAGSMCHPAVDSEQEVTATCQPAGTLAAGEPCSWLECQPGYICAADGRCRHLCCGGDWSVCQADESCTGAVELLAPAGFVVSAGVGVCEPTDDCDVFDETSCPGGQSCYIIDSRGGLGCLPTGSSDAYELCSTVELCKAGLTCVASHNGVGTCRRLCRAVVGGTPECPPTEGMTCSHYAHDPPGVGECVPFDF